jgi:hypothetical protein
MAKHSSHILDLARKGAEHKYEELKAEIAALVKHFPHLAGRARATVSRRAAALSTGGRAAFARGRAAFAAVADEVTPRKRRKMSAKARKAIGDAQRKRWAAQRAGAKK